MKPWRRVTGALPTTLLVMALLALPIGAPAIAQDADLETGPQDKFEAIQTRFAEAQRQFFMEMQSVSDPKDMTKMVETKMPDFGAYSREALAIAEAHPGSDVAYECLQWILITDQSMDAPMKAADLVIRDFIQDDRMIDLAEGLNSLSGQAPSRVLRALVEHGPDEDTRAIASIGLARCLLMTAEFSSRVLNDTPENIALASAYFGDKAMAYYRSADSDALRREVERILETAVKKYPEAALNEGTLVDVADTMLFALRNLGIGKVAPEIAGEDIEGVSFKLSDYRGKVVMLDFWGDW